MYKDSEQRNYEVTSMFDIICKLRRDQGKTMAESRTAAYDAIELRFDLSKTRARNIICEVRKINSSRQSNCPYRFKHRVGQLLQILSEITDHIK